MMCDLHCCYGGLEDMLCPRLHLLPLRMKAMLLRFRGLVAKTRIRTWRTSSRMHLLAHPSGHTRLVRTRTHIVQRPKPGCPQSEMISH